MFNARLNNYNLRKFQELATEKKRAVKNVIDTLSYRTSQLWSLLPEGIKLQPTFTCSKLTVETLGQGVKYVQS